MEVEAVYALLRPRIPEQDVYHYITLYSVSQGTRVVDVTVHVRQLEYVTVLGYEVGFK